MTVGTGVQLLYIAGFRICLDRKLPRVSHCVIGKALKASMPGFAPSLAAPSRYGGPRDGRPDDRRPGWDDRRRLRSRSRGRSRSRSRDTRKRSRSDERRQQAEQQKQEVSCGGSCSLRVKRAGW